MVADALRQVMLAADGAGELRGAAVVTGAAEHPVCGDVLELDCRIEAGRVIDLAWRANGCPATMAVAAAARSAVRGHPVGEAVAGVRRRVAELGGLAPTQRHALALFERAFAAALAAGGGGA